MTYDLLVVNSMYLVRTFGDVCWLKPVARSRRSCENTAVQLSLADAVERVHAATRALLPGFQWAF